MKTELSIWSQYYYEMSPEDAVDEFIKNGLHAYELSDEHGMLLLNRDKNIVETGKRFASFLEQRGFSVPQGHLCLSIKICTQPESVNELFRWIDLYEAIGIRNMVLHCDTSLPTDLSFDTCAAKNAEKLKLIAEYIDGKNVNICLENLTKFTISAEHLIDIIDRVGSEKFGICLDTGHLNMTGMNQRSFILAAGKHLRALHIADNEGERDQHMMPYCRGKIDFAEVMRALREIDYHGLFNLEIPGESHIPLELRAAKIRYIQSCYDYLLHLP